MKPITLEIVTRVMTTLGHCRHCEVLFEEADIAQKLHQRDMNEYPQDLVDEYLRLSDWLKELRHLYQHRLLIKIIDVQSLLGIFKSLRHRIRNYPTFIIEGKEVYTGWNRDQLETLLDKQIKVSLLSKGPEVHPLLS